MAGVSVRTRKTVSQIAGDRAVVVPVCGDAAQPGGVYTLNESASAIWSMIESGSSVAQVAAYLQTEYGISAQQAAEDTKEFLAALADEGLVELA